MPAELGRPVAPEGWDDLGDRWRRTFTFVDFAEAWAFMGRVAVHAERLGHHPDWSNSWNRVSIELTTHDTGGVSSLDAALAAAIDDCR
jgi:4a-hydroxytetrahydrobiopterin dehydratase